MLVLSSAVASHSSRRNKFSQQQRSGLVFPATSGATSYSVAQQRARSLALRISSPPSPTLSEKTTRRRSTSTATSSSSTSTTTSEADSDEVRSIGPESDFQLIDLSDLGLCVLPDFIGENADQVEHLILDCNQLTETALEDLPVLKNLKTLSLNGNKLKNIGLVLQVLMRTCPNLRHLSLIGNPGWPHPILGSSTSLSQYRSYANAATRLLPTLQFLDTAAVRNAEVSKSTGGVDSHCKLL